MPSLFTAQYGVTGLLALGGCWAARFGAGRRSRPLNRRTSGHLRRRVLGFGRSWIIWHHTGWPMESYRRITGLELENKDEKFVVVSSIFALLDRIFSLQVLLLHSSQYSCCRIIAHRPFQSSGTVSSQPIRSHPRYRLFHLHPSTTANGSPIQTKSRNALHQSSFLDWTQRQVWGPSEQEGEPLAIHTDRYDGQTKSLFSPGSPTPETVDFILRVVGNGQA